MLEVLAAAMIVSISGAVAPGPLTTYAISSLTRRPLVSSVLLTLGHAVPEVGIVIAIACGIHSLPFTDVIALAGSAVLFVFGGVQVVRPVPLSDAGRVDAMPFAYGITVTVSNPYWWIWWLTFGAGFLAVHDGYAEFFAGHIGIDFLWLFLLAALAARGRTILGDHYRTIVRGCGAAMMIFAVYFAASVVWG